VKEHHGRVSTEENGQSLHPTRTKERKIFVANFRKINGHDILNANLDRFGIKSSPLCSLCQTENQTAEHLLDCETLEDMVQMLKSIANDEQELFSKCYWHVRTLQ
jgi:hypothetical protein